MKLLLQSPLLFFHDGNSFYRSKKAQTHLLDSFNNIVIIVFL